MITSEKMPAYFTTDSITYTCISGYSQRIEKEISCICNVINNNHWSCTVEVADFENECEKGQY